MKIIATSARDARLYEIITNNQSASWTLKNSEITSKTKHRNQAKEVKFAVGGKKLNTIIKKFLANNVFSHISR